MSTEEDKKQAEEYKLQHQIQKTHVDILNKAGQDGMNYAAALKAKLKFDKVARKFLLKYDSESKLMQFSADNKIKLADFQKTFEKEFIPEFSEKIFEIIYEYNLHNPKDIKEEENNDGAPVVQINLALAASLAVEEQTDEKENENENNENANKNENHEITRLDCQRFIKSSKQVRKHIRERSLMPLSTIFQKTQFSDISADAGKVNYDQFCKVFSDKLGKAQCDQAFNIMKDKNGEIGIVAYNNFRDKGVHKMLGDAMNEEHDDEPQSPK